MRIAVCDKIGHLHREMDMWEVATQSAIPSHFFVIRYFKLVTGFIGFFLWDAHTENFRLKASTSAILVEFGFENCEMNRNAIWRASRELTQTRFWHCFQVIFLLGVEIPEDEEEPRRDHLSRPEWHGTFRIGSPSDVRQRKTSLDSRTPPGVARAHGSGHSLGVQPKTLHRNFCLVFKRSGELYRSGYSRTHQDQSVVALDRALTSVPRRPALEADRTSRTVPDGSRCGNASPDRHVTSLMLSFLMLSQCFES